MSSGRRHSSGGSADGSMLDRMEDIAEEGIELRSRRDDTSMEGDEVFERSGSSFGHEDALFGGNDEEDAEDQFDHDDDDDDNGSNNVDYDWNPTNLDNDGGRLSSHFQVSAITLEDMVGGVGGNGDSLSEETSYSSNRRSSFKQFQRRASNSRMSFGSMQSGHFGTAAASPAISPAPPRGILHTPAGKAARQDDQGLSNHSRPGPEEDSPNEKDSKLPPKPFSQTPRSASRRRQSFSFKQSGKGAASGGGGSASVASSGSSNHDGDESVSTPSGSQASSRSDQHRFVRKSRRSLTIPSSVHQSLSGKDGNHVSSVSKLNNSTEGFDSVDSAIQTLGGSGAGTGAEWEHVAAAAAAIVASGTPGKGSTKRPRIQFAVDERALVFLNILNHTNSVDPREAFTINPVNKYGFPPGEGKKPQEQQGPYVYVLSTIRKLHFDEDVPYYTVARADTGTEQRADTGEYQSMSISNRYTSFSRCNCGLSCPSRFVRNMLNSKQTDPFLDAFPFVSLQNLQPGWNRSNRL